MLASSLPGLAAATMGHVWNLASNDCSASSMLTACSTKELAW